MIHPPWDLDDVSDSCCKQWRGECTSYECSEWDLGRDHVAERMCVLGAVVPPCVVGKYESTQCWKTDEIHAMRALTFALVYMLNTH